MILAILAAVWLVILAPSGVEEAIRWHAGTSIASFHHELHTLEHTGPKLVSPAFRLQTANAGNGRDGLPSSLPAVTSMPGRPSLVLLEPNVELEDAGPLVGSSPLDPGLPPRHYEGARALGGDVRPRSSLEHGRNLARRRRRVTFGLLVGVVASTGALGLDRPYRLAWAATATVGAVLVVYGALALYARWLGLLEEGRRRSPPPTVGRTAGPARQAAIRQRRSEDDWNPDQEAELDGIGRRARHAAGAVRGGNPSTQSVRWAQFEAFYAEVGDDEDWPEDLREAAGGR